MSTQGSSQLAFGKAPAKFNVAESDYLVMASSKIGTFSELAFRFPRSEVFESYMVRTLRTRGAYRSGDTIRVYDIATPMPREDYTYALKVSMPFWKRLMENFGNFADGGGMLTLDGKKIIFHRELACRPRPLICPKCRKYHTFWA